MPRPHRIEQNGFYHIINRGVAKSIIYHEDEDYLKFLEIVQDASDEYGFEVYAYCLMGNHYHLLVKITNENLSLALQKINSRYSIYYNKKNHRVGPLWQGRFKSWYVYDTNYLQILVRYIEFNPIKAGIATKIGQYKWAMSSRNVEAEMFNYELIDTANMDKALDENELKKIDELYSAKLELKDDYVSKKEFMPLDEYFKQTIGFLEKTKTKNPALREKAVYEAIKEGYKASQVADRLHLSRSAITKIVKHYKQKVSLFERLKGKGIFWSYSKEMTYDETRSSLLIEYVLKYADFDDIKLCLELFGKREAKAVWERTMKSDKSFIKTNLMIARVFFGMDVESDYFKGVKNARLEKLRMLAS